MFGEDDRVEFVNLYEEDSGIPGRIFVSTIMGPHGPRVKYSKETGKGAQSFSVSITADPRLVANSLSERDLNRASPLVIAWVRLNRDALLRFWNEGEDWSVNTVVAFAKSLKKV